MNKDFKIGTLSSNLGANWTLPKDNYGSDYTNRVNERILSYIPEPYKSWHKCFLRMQTPDIDYHGKEDSFENIDFVNKLYNSLPPLLHPKNNPVTASVKQLTNKNGQYRAWGWIAVQHWGLTDFNLSYFINNKGTLNNLDPKGGLNFARACNSMRSVIQTYMANPPANNNNIWNWIKNSLNEILPAVTGLLGMPAVGTTLAAMLIQSSGLIKESQFQLSDGSIISTNQDGLNYSSVSNEWIKYGLLGAGAIFLFSSLKKR